MTSIGWQELICLAVIVFMTVAVVAIVIGLAFWIGRKTAK